MMAHLYFVALNVHFESQCIPTPLAWYAHHLPTWILRLFTVDSNVIELAVPFLFFFPNRKVRIMAFYLQVCNNCLEQNITGYLQNYVDQLIDWLLFKYDTLMFQVFLQIGIIATGNYNFFNFLTICLCISLLDDQFFYKRKSKNDKSRIRNYLSQLITVLIYAGLIYGTYIYYGLKIMDNWTIQSNISNYRYFIDTN